MPDGFDPATIEARIRAYEGFGIHRTGWPGDDQTSEWLIDELTSMGVEAASERFSFPRVVTRRARVSWGSGVRDYADGVPRYDGGFTKPDGVSGEFVGGGGNDPRGKIVVMTSAASDAAVGQPHAATERFGALAEAGAVGAVVSTGTDSSIRLSNAESIERPFNLPVLQVAPDDIRDLAAAMSMGAVGVLEIDGERLPSSAANVVATVPGSDPNAEPLAIITSKSGWFTCAGERGGGVAIWLALAEHLAAAPPRHTVHLLASSAHELHHRGLAHWLSSRTALVRSAVLTFHLGASIGARHGLAEFGASDELWHRAARDALAGAGVDLDTVAPLPIGSHGGGEARNIDELGGRFVSFLGDHRYFHMPEDTVDRAVDAAAIARWARAARTIVNVALGRPDSERAAPRRATE